MRQEGILRKPARDRDGSAGFVGMLIDPDGNALELSFGQNARDYLEAAD